MDISVRELFLSCRLGDIERVRYLVEGRKVNLNARDDHDSSPLYYAVLCGHTEVCRYLLERGAHCREEDDGNENNKRIYQVAHTDELQQLLRDYSSGKARKTVDPFMDMLKNAFADDSFADWEVVVKVSEGPALRLPLHSAIVSVRCPVLAAAASQSHLGENNDNNNGARHEICLCSLELYNVVTIRAVLEYLYTGMIECRSDSTIISEMILVAALLGLKELEQELNDASKYKRRTIMIDHRQQLRADMARLSDCVMANQREDQSTTSTHSSLLDDLVMHSADTVLYSQQDDTRFMVHRFVLCGHSEYFRRALLGAFREANTGVLSLPASGRAVAATCEWMYTDQWKETPDPDLCMELIELADHLMLPQLASLAGTLLVPCVNLDNALDVLSLSRLYSLENLEACCLRVIALCIEEIIETSETEDALRALIHEEVSAAMKAGETDIQGVPLVVDMKKVITDHFEYLGEDDDSKIVEKGSSHAHSAPKQLRMKRHDKLRLLEDMLEDVSTQATCSRRD